MRVTDVRRVVVAIGLVLAIGAGTPAASAHVAGHATATPGWRIVHYFGACDSLGVLSVTATGASDAWATGQAYRFQCDRPGLLIAHWDGSSWRLLPPPSRFAGFVPDFIGTSVAALSSSYSWDFAIKGPTYPVRSFALLWQAGRWRAFRLTNGVTLDFSGVFNRSDAWAFGTISGNNPHNPGATVAYGARFDGRSWRRVQLPVLPQDAAFPGPRNIWLVGQLPHQGPFALAHWTGRWQTTPFPRGIVPSGGFTARAWVVPDGSGGAWVAVAFERDNFDNPIGGALLRWTGSRWVQVKVPYPTLSLGPLSRDGNGGLWIESSTVCPGCLINAMFHYNAGTWSKAPVHIPGLIVTGMRLIPGTRSVWASGTGVTVPGGQGDEVGVMMKYGP
jgi:hypothetical protein